MQKILILGCSYTAGSYKLRTVPEPNNISTLNHKKYLIFEPIIDIVDNYHGWWYFCDFFKDKDVTVVTIPGQGYFGYLQVLIQLVEDLKYHYDLVFVQETREPRISFTNWITNNIALQNPEFVDNFKYIHIESRHSFQLSPCRAENYQEYSIHETFNKMLSRSAGNKLQEFAYDNNIKGYRFNFANFIELDNTYFPLIDLGLRHTLLKELREKNLLVTNSDNCHQTEEGNKYIGKLLNEKIHEYINV